MDDQPKIESLVAEIRKLRERVEDLEDLRDLDDAIARNAGAPGVPWEVAKPQLEID